MLQLDYRISSKLIRARWVPKIENMDMCLQEDLLLENNRFISVQKYELAPCPKGY